MSSNSSFNQSNGLLKFAKIALLPISYLYAGVMAVRNKFFDWGWFKSEKPQVFTIGVGNLALGGTGKTPMSIYLAEKLITLGYKPGFVSRGYGRKTKGLMEVRLDGTAEQFGDEPLLVKGSFPAMPVWVSEKRVFGISAVIKQGVNVILLDDNYQHRSVKVHFQMLLTKYDFPFFKDHVIPSGYLRELPNAANRADSIVVTSCPNFNINEGLVTGIAQWSKAPISLSKHKMGDVLWMGTAPNMDKLNVLLVTGIANPFRLYEHCQNIFHTVNLKQYSDHYDFTTKNLQMWLKVVEKKIDKAENYAIITTSKDWVKIKKLLHPQTFNLLKIGVIPVKIEMDNNLLMKEIEDRLARFYGR